jgi:hypothetical protein
MWRESKEVLHRGRAFFRITEQKCAADIVREFEKGSPVIFPGRSYGWLMEAQPLLLRRLISWRIAQAAREIRGRASKRAA